MSKYEKSNKSDSSSTEDCKRTPKAKPCPKPHIKPCPCPVEAKCSCSCPGNNCCGNANCLVASCDPCEIVCASEFQNLVVTSKKFIAIPLGLGTSSPLPSPFTFCPVNFFVSLPETCSGPVNIVWSVGNTILNLYQACNLNSLLNSAAGILVANITLRLNILTQKSVYDLAKSPANVNSGFGNFGTCVCKDATVTYSLNIVFNVDPSSGVITGSVTVLNSNNEIILVPGLVDAEIRFLIQNNGSTIRLFVGDDPTLTNIVTPAVILSFTESKNVCDKRNTFWSMLDLSKLQV